MTDDNIDTVDFGLAPRAQTTSPSEGAGPSIADFLAELAEQAQEAAKAAQVAQLGNIIETMTTIVGMYTAMVGDAQFEG